MANTNIPKSFKAQEYHKSQVVRLLCAASFAGQGGIGGGSDVAIINSAGKVDNYGSGSIVGLVMGAIVDKTNGSLKTTAADGDFINVIADPDVLFKGQISNYTQTDPYTTRVSTACYDVAGSAGVQYVDAGANSNDHIKVINISTEIKDGAYSATGNYAKARFRFNPSKHFSVQIS
jgi:hypothetical protein